MAKIPLVPQIVAFYPVLLQLFYSQICSPQEAGVLRRHWPRWWACWRTPGSAGPPRSHHSLENTNNATSIPTINNNQQLQSTTIIGQDGGLAGGHLALLDRLARTTLWKTPTMQRQYQQSSTINNIINNNHETRQWACWRTPGSAGPPRSHHSLENTNNATSIPTINNNQQVQSTTIIGRDGGLAGGYSLEQLFDKHLQINTNNIES